jgi:S-disulfanyl-L-cysteine oxidoreductase SoxD
MRAADMCRDRLKISASSLRHCELQRKPSTQNQFSILKANLVGRPEGEGGIGDQLVGGQGTLASPKPVRTVGSYWPYAPTLFDYIRRAMPQNAPQSLSIDDVYAVSAYILNLNGLLPADATLDAKTLSAIEMPNRSMFVGDPRPDVKNPACMTGC